VAGGLITEETKKGGEECRGEGEGERRRKRGEREKNEGVRANLSSTHMGG